MKKYTYNGIELFPQNGYVTHPVTSIAYPVSWSEMEDIDIEDIPDPEPEQPTLEQQFEAVRMALQSAIDVKAQEFEFSSGNSLMLYAGFTNPFQALAQQFATWEAGVWLEAGQYKAQVIAGTQPMLTPEQAVAMMPEYA